MRVPEKIGHNFTFYKRYDLSLLNTRFSTHRRLRVFHTHGTACSAPGCNKVGVHLIKAKNTDGGFHVDIYTADFELMTIDHIIPKSKGGTNDLENLQPMCNSCNAKKADKFG
jgi:5-methylcytosine-specific restriction endonuclease McrA